MESTFEPKFVSFSQRRFLGFRNRFEFDKKRILICSDNKLSIVAYDQLERPYELYRGELKMFLENRLSPTKRPPAEVKIIMA